MNDAQTVHDVTYDLLRSLGLTTVFGNPGSTEQTSCNGFQTISPTFCLCRRRRCSLWPTDLRNRRQARVVNVHTAAGTGNAMGNLVAASPTNTPLIITAGQQTRKMVLCEPY